MTRRELERVRRRLLKFTDSMKVLACELNDDDPDHERIWEATLESQLLFVDAVDLISDFTEHSVWQICPDTDEDEADAELDEDEIDTLEKMDESFRG